MVCSNLLLGSTDLHLSLELEHGRMKKMSAWHSICICVGVSGEGGGEKVVTLLW